jgi:hypothetical protein
VHFDYGSQQLTSNAIPPTSGVSLKARHYETVLEQNPSIGWFEIHPENYMGDGGPPHRYLTAIRENYPLSMHGVGMSLGSADGVEQQHLQSLGNLVERYQPGQVSEHLAWSHFNKKFHNDLLPLPYNDESLQTVVANIIQVQEALGRTILVENPSSYLEFRDSAYTEPEFLGELTRRTDCGLLLDVNNIYVSACNQGFDPYQYLTCIPWDRVGEIHLAGHAVNQIDDVQIRIDDHGSPVVDAVWALHEQALRHLGRRVPVMIEWDTDVPELDVLLGEAAKANAIADRLLPLVNDAA